MSQDTRPEPIAPEAPKPVAEPQTTEEHPEVFHPHKHEHTSIKPAQTDITHLDPGVVTF